MAVPKRKTSKARRDKRRSANMKMTAPGLSVCPQCHEPKLPHRVCPNCNYYDGKEVVAILLVQFDAIRRINPSVGASGMAMQATLKHLTHVQESNLSLHIYLLKNI